MIPEWMSFVPEISSFVLHRHDKINWRAQPQAKFSLAWFCFVPDQIHMRYSLQTTKNNNNLWFHLNFQSVWVFGELNPSPCSRVFTSAASVDCSALSYLFSSAIAPISCSQKLLQNVAKNLKTVKTEKKQNKTKQKEKKIRFFGI